PDHVFIGLGGKGTSAARWIVYRFADLRIDDTYHNADDFARGEELAAVVAFFSHFEEQTFKYLGERENVGCIYCRFADVVNLIQYVQQICIRVYTRLFNA